MPKKRRVSQNVLFRHRSAPVDPRKQDVRDVTLSSKERRRRRQALWLMAGKCLVITVGVVWALTFAAKVWSQTFAKHPGYAIGDFIFKSNVAAERGGLTRERILDVTGLRGDVNVLSVDVASVQRSILSLPQVASVEVGRNFPNRVEIEVKERRPIAWLDCPALGIKPRDSQSGRLVDANYVVFTCNSLTNTYQHLPQIFVSHLTKAEPGKAIEDRLTRECIALVDHFADFAWPPALGITSVRIAPPQDQVASPYVINVTLTDHAEVKFLAENVVGQLERLAYIYQHAARDGKAVATVNLVPRRNVPVTYFSQTAAATPPRDDLAPRPTHPHISSSPPPQPAASSTPPARSSSDNARRSPPSEASSIEAIMRGT